MEPWQPKSDLFILNHRFAQAVLFLVAAGIALGIVRALFRRRYPNLQGDSVQRHSPGVAVAHWVNAVGVILCLISGFTILPYVRTAVSKLALYQIHLIGAGLTLVALLAVAVQANLGGSKRQIFPRAADLQAMWLELLAYAGLLGDEGILGFRGLQWPAAWRRSLERSTGYRRFHGKNGKYLATEKVLSYPLWALIILVVVATGIIKAVRYIYPVPQVVTEWSTRLHDWSLWAALVMLLVHAGAVVLVRSNWPLLASMFTTRVSAAYARARHALWYAELTAEAEQAAEQAAAQARGAGEKAVPRGGTAKGRS